MPNLPPNYMKVTTSYDAKKGISQRGIESAEWCAQNKDGKMNMPVMKRTLKNFGSTRSFRRRSRSAIIHIPLKSQSANPSSVEVSESSSSPHYSKATSCSGGKSYSHPSLRSSQSSFDSSDPSQSPRKAVQTFSSMRSVKILMNKTSFKSKRGSCRIPDVATCSSTLKDSTFPEHVELQPGQTESDRISKFKVCSYHHCSLHGGHYGDLSPPIKHIYRRRRLLKSQKSICTKRESRNGEKFPVNEDAAPQLSPTLDPLVCEESSTIEDAGVFKVIEAIDLAEIAFGETSFPEQSYQETLDIMRKYSTQEQALFTDSKCCNCMGRECYEATAVNDSKDDSSTASALSSHQDRNISLILKQDGSVSESVKDESNSRKPSKNGAFSITTRSLLNDFDESESNKRNSSVSASNIKLECGEMQVKDCKGEAKNFPPFEVVDLNASTQESHKQLLPRKKQMNMWNLIRRHMILDAADSENKLADRADDENNQNGVNNSPSAETPDTCSVFSERELMSAHEDAENQEIELQKLFTIKLVREAIEKILLPEVQDQLSDDQSVTSDACADQESLEMSHSEVSTKVYFKGSDNKNDLASESENLNTEDIGGSEKRTKKEEVTNKSEKRAPKHWSNLKKWLILQRFIKELEKVRKINPRRLRNLQLNPDAEAEKVRLRPQTADERKKAEEWMLDHALQQAIGQLALTQQRKVELLIKAFETVVPPQGDSSQAAFTKLRASSEENLQITSKKNAFVSEAGNMRYNTEKVIAGIDRESEDNDCSIMGQQFDEVTRALNDEVLVEGKTQKENQEDECYLGSELQIDVPRKEISSAISSFTDAVDRAHETDMNVSSISECVTTENVTITSDEKVETAEGVELQGSQESTALDLHSASPTGESVARDGKLKLDNQDDVSGDMEETKKECETKLRVVWGFSLLLLKSGPKEDDAATLKVDKQNYISMWHMISQHVLSDVASKVGNELLDGTDDEVENSSTPAEMKTCSSLQDFSDTKDDADTSKEDHNPSHHGRSFCRDDAVKLIQEGVNEILATPIQDDSSDTQSVTSDIIMDQEFSETEVGATNSSNSTEESLTNFDTSKGGKVLDQETKDREVNTIITEEDRALPLAMNKPEPLKSKNWSKLKKLILLKRSIKALERARKFNPRAPQLLTPTPDEEPEKVGLKHQVIDEKKKAEQWMLDYAMQHIVTKLTPARKKRVAMLVEAFEAVVPLPDV